MVRAIVVCAILLALAGCQKPEPKPQGVAVNSASTTIEVKTAKCESCSETITAALENVDGVEKVSVDLDDKKVHVQYVAAKVNLATLENAIASVGYDANSTKRNETAYQSLDACCQ